MHSCQVLRNANMALTEHWPVVTVRQWMVYILLFCVSESHQSPTWQEDFSPIKHRSFDRQHFLKYGTRKEDQAEKTIIDIFLINLINFIICSRFVLTRILVLQTTWDWTNAPKVVLLCVQDGLHILGRPVMVL
jgi:hypothetical protein